MDQGEREPRRHTEERGGRERERRRWETEKGEMGEERGRDLERRE